MHQWLLQRFDSCEKQKYFSTDYQEDFWAAISWPWNPAPPPQIMNCDRSDLSHFNRIQQTILAQAKLRQNCCNATLHIAVSHKEKHFGSRTGHILLSLFKWSKSPAGTWVGSLELAIPWQLLGLGELHLTGRVRHAFLFMESLLQCLSCAMAKRGLRWSISYDYSSHGQSVSSGSCGDIEWRAFIGTSWMVRMSQLQCSHT